MTSLWGASAALARGVCLLGIIMPNPLELLTGDVLLFPKPGHGVARAGGEESVCESKASLCSRRFGSEHRAQLPSLAGAKLL